MKRLLTAILTSAMVTASYAADYIRINQLGYIPKATKVAVFLSNETRSVVSGIAKHFTPEELVGKKVVFVTNLKPVKLCGVLSEGMILAAEDDEGNFSLICPETNVKHGTRLG